MQIYQFIAPSDWANCRNIDEEVKPDDMNYNVDNLDDDASADGDKSPEKPPEKKED